MFKRISLSILLTALTLVFIHFATVKSPFYGMVLFIGPPFTLSMLCAFIFGSIPKEKPLYTFLTLAFIVLLIIAGLLFLGIEGLICIIMLLPLLTIPVASGWAVGMFLLHKFPPPHKKLPLIILLPYLALAALHTIEGTIDQQPPLRSVSTQMHIDASPDAVWTHVIAFTEIPEPDDWIFRAGVAYPTHATIEGTGPGAIRRCEFSTGTFIEPITTWEEGKLLQFSVTQTPFPMHELSPYTNLTPAHFHDTFYSERGEFRFEPQADGSTLLIGTTWYRQHLFPLVYWHRWSDWIIHRIHRRVLNHIKDEAEMPPLNVAHSPSPQSHSSAAPDSSL